MSTLLGYGNEVSKQHIPPLLLCKVQHWSNGTTDLDIFEIRPLKNPLGQACVQLLEKIATQDMEDADDFIEEAD